MGTKKDIDFTKPIGHATRQWIKAHGTKEQRQQLADYDFAQLTPGQQQSRAEYLDKLAATEVPADSNEPKRLQNCLGRLYRTMQKRTAGPTTSPADLYKAAKVLLWRAYEAQVLFETGGKPSMHGRPNLVMALHQVAHWLVGQESNRIDQLCDCEGMKVRLVPIRKSLYLVGPLGTGKSTVALAASYASRQLNGEYNTGMRLEYTSLDEMIVQVYSQQSLAPVEAASKGSMVLDEMRTEHVGYKHFGNDVRILADILLVRHHAWKQTGAQTIITSNIPPGDLFALLKDERLGDRMVQQYQPITISGKSLRKAQPALQQISAPASAPKNEVA